MPLTLTARRMEAARAIKASLAEAYAVLHAATDADVKAAQEALIVALQERLVRRRVVVMNARAVSLANGVTARRRRLRRQPVWGFPTGYNPNFEQDRCEICRAVDRWVERRLPQHPQFGDMGSAWTCAACSNWSSAIPQD